MKIQTIVEGHGEVEALPVLRRFIDAAQVWTVGVGQPIRRPRNRLVQEDGVRRAVRLALEQPECGAVLVLLDGNSDCPAEGCRSFRKLTDSFASLVRAMGHGIAVASPRLDGGRMKGGPNYHASPPVGRPACGCRRDASRPRSRRGAETGARSARTRRGGCGPAGAYPWSESPLSFAPAVSGGAGRWTPLPVAMGAGGGDHRATGVGGACSVAESAA